MSSILLKNCAEYVANGKAKTHCCQCPCLCHPSIIPQPELQSLKVSDKGNSVTLHSDEIGRVKPIPSAGYVSMKGAVHKFLPSRAISVICDHHPATDIMSEL